MIDIFKDRYTLLITLWFNFTVMLYSRYLPHRRINSHLRQRQEKSVLILQAETRKGEKVSCSSFGMIINDAIHCYGSLKLHLSQYYTLVISSKMEIPNHFKKTCTFLCWKNKPPDVDLYLYTFRYYKTDENDKIKVI